MALENQIHDLDVEVDRLRRVKTEHAKCVAKEKKHKAAMLQKALPISPHTLPSPSSSISPVQELELDELRVRLALVHLVVGQLG